MYDPNVIHITVFYLFVIPERWIRVYNTSIGGSHIPRGHAGYEEATEDSCKARCMDHDDLDTPCRSVTYRANSPKYSNGNGNCILRSVKETGGNLREKSRVDYFVRTDIPSK